jgi:hypothetical protein
MAKVKLTSKDIEKTVDKIELEETLENMKTIVNYENTYKLVPEVIEKN